MTVAPRRPVSPWAVAAALPLPPLGVYLDPGIGRDFWIAVALTCLGFVPGLLYALFALLVAH